MTYYKQGAIQKKNITMIIWIPEEYVVKDKLLKIKLHGIWEDGWKVIRTFSVRKSEKDVLENEDVYILANNIKENKE